MPKITLLENGIKIITEPLKDFKSCAVAIWIKSGTIYENEYENGISHFIEHMLFKGTEKLSENDIYDISDSLGGSLNAYTTKEYTCVVIRTLENYIGTAFDLISDMVLNSVFDKDCIEKEKAVIKAEINTFNDSPENMVHELIHNAAFKSSPVGRPILGTAKSIEEFDRDKLLKYFKRRYKANNIVISAAGNFDEKKFIYMAENKFACIDSSAETGITKPNIYIPGKKVFESRDIRQTHICIGFPGISRDSRLKYPYMVFNAVLGEGINSMLFKSLRGSGLVYTAYSYMTAYSDTGMFNIYIASDGEKSHEAYNRAIEICKDFNKAFEKINIEKIKRSIINSYIMGRESVISAVNSAGGSVILRGRAITDNEVIGGINRVTASDVADTAENILRYEKMCIAASGYVDYFEKGIKNP